MAMIKWSDSLSVNVAEIDKQHQKLVSMINELSDAMKEGKGKNILGKIINELIAYTGEHFKTEEKYFLKFIYPETVAHKSEHDEFVRKVSEFETGFREGKMLLSIEIMNFLSDWLTKHIKVSDKQYGPFFNEKGLV